MPRKKPRTVLIVNPNAGRSSEGRRTEVVEAIRSRFDLDVLVTSGRDTAITLAADVAAAKEPFAIAFGGDGHVNEVANGLAGTETALAIVPGGTMNVFARALEVPLDPFEAIDHLLARLKQGAAAGPARADGRSLLHVLRGLRFRCRGGRAGRALRSFEAPLRRTVLLLERFQSADGELSPSRSVDGPEGRLRRGAGVDGDRVERRALCLPVQPTDPDRARSRFSGRHRRVRAQDDADRSPSELRVAMSRIWGSRPSPRRLLRERPGQVRALLRPAFRAPRRRRASPAVRSARFWVEPDALKVLA